MVTEEDIKNKYSPRVVDAVELIRNKKGSVKNNSISFGDVSKINDLLSELKINKRVKAHQVGDRHTMELIVREVKADANEEKRQERGKAKDQDRKEAKKIEKLAGQQNYSDNIEESSENKRIASEGKMKSIANSSDLKDISDLQDALVNEIEDAPPGYKVTRKVEEQLGIVHKRLADIGAGNYIRRPFDQDQQRVTLDVPQKPVETFFEITKKIEQKKAEIQSLNDYITANKIRLTQEQRDGMMNELKKKNLDLIPLSREFSQKRAIEEERKRLEEIERKRQAKYDREHKKITKAISKPQRIIWLEAKKAPEKAASPSKSEKAVTSEGRALDFKIIDTPNGKVKIIKSLDGKFHMTPYFFTSKAYPNVMLSEEAKWLKAKDTKFKLLEKLNSTRLKESLNSQERTNLRAAGFALSQEKRGRKARP